MKDGSTNKIATVPEKTIADSVLNKVMLLEQGGGLNLPANYSAANALKSAYLKLKKDGLIEKCTKDSIANSLLDMVVQGLSTAKNQCYFIPYGKECQLQRSYFGTVSVAKRVADIEDVKAFIIYDGEEFEYELNTETMKVIVKKHTKSLANIDNTKILGGYAVIYNSDGIEVSEPMTIDEIRAAWGQGAMKGNSPAHKNFTQEMAKKTIINRACKMIFNTSDDSDILIDAINRTTANEYPSETDYEEVVEKEIEEHANKEEIDFEPEVEVEEEPNQVDWESSISVIALIEQIQDTKEYNTFLKENKSRLSVFGGKDEEMILKAMQSKEAEILKPSSKNERGF